jgi:PAS domain S-box-containing protein
MKDKKKTGSLLLPEPSIDSVGRGELEGNKIEDVYRTAIEHSNDGVVIVRGKEHLFCNKTCADMLGYDNQEQIVANPLCFAVHRRDRTMVMNYARRRQGGEPAPSRYECRFIKKDGSVIYVELSAVMIIYDGKPASLGFMRDITERKRLEEQVKSQQKQLEQKVKERTAELRESKREVEIKSRALEEVNTALRVLLGQREKDRKELEERFVSNIKQLVLPSVKKLKQGKLDARQASYLNIVESNLKEIISPFLHTIRQLNFTPKELEVVHFIKDGKSTKEIAEIMRVATSSIDSHRNNIRNKLGLLGKKASLQSYLHSLS